jgi:RNA polymerase sigma-70 factor, ECF subfamily
MDLYPSTRKIGNHACLGPKDLLERFAKGDLDAFEILFRQFQGKVYAWIVRVVRDSGAAEDLTVETFWRIYRARARFNPQADFGAWAYRIAINLALSHLRRKPQETELTGDEPSPGTSDSAWRQEAHEQIRRAFQRLPPKLQVVAAMALIEERPYQEISQTLGIATGTVKSRVFRAVRILRKQLQRMRVHV